MKLLFIRHGDPDYKTDSLTEKGHREAQFLARRLAELDVKACYVSPLGRARDTAAYTFREMERKGKPINAVECSWLREFAPLIDRPDAPGKKRIAWDWLPQDWLADSRFLDRERWYEPRAFSEAGVREEYAWVTDSFDTLLASHGYHREGDLYLAKEANNDTLLFFCHFGVTCILLGHLIHISPMALWHGFCAAPTSVTTVITEERRREIASFRVNGFGDISHLSANGEPPAFAARFCECYENEGERRD